MASGSNLPRPFGALIEQFREQWNQQFRDPKKLPEPEAAPGQVIPVRSSDFSAELRALRGQNQRVAEIERRAGDTIYIGGSSPPDSWDLRSTIRVTRLKAPEPPPDSWDLRSVETEFQLTVKARYFLLRESRVEASHDPA